MVKVIGMYYMTCLLGIDNMIREIVFTLFFIGFSFCFIFNNVNELLWVIGFIIMIICGILETKQV